MRLLADLLPFTESGGQCIECDSIQWGPVIGLFIASFVFIGIFHSLSQETNPLTKLFFCESAWAALVFGLPIASARTCTCGHSALPSVLACVQTTSSKCCSSSGPTRRWSRS
jgi:hypothetical protein